LVGTSTEIKYCEVKQHPGFGESRGRKIGGGDGREGRGHLNTIAPNFV